MTHKFRIVKHELPQGETLIVIGRGQLGTDAPAVHLRQYPKGGHNVALCGSVNTWQECEDVATAYTYAARILAGDTIEALVEGSR